MNKKTFKNKKAIFVDYFDTLVFRKIKTYDVYYRWAYILKNKYKELEDVLVEDIVDSRIKTTYDLKDKYEEIPYDILMGSIREKYNINEDLEIFVSESFNNEVAIENGVQYLNKKLYRILKKEKQKGKKIYLVSDFYLNKDAYNIFLKRLGIEDLFENVFISVDYDKTKRRKEIGTLYQEVLKQTNLKKEEVVMIGDNIHSDYNVARNAGIDAIHYKKIIKSRKRTYLTFPNKFLKNKSKEWEKGLYLEYSYYFYIFIHRLYNKVHNDGVKKLAFLSREGLALKKMFDIYQSMKVSKANRINTFYVYNSRKLNKQISDEIEENGNSDYVEYLKQYYDDGYLNIVDSGWNNSAQESIGKYSKVKTRGYYIGTFSKKEVDYECNREGLIYDIKEDGTTSDYYWSLRTNFTLIEQLLAANHGSVDSYNDKKFSFTWVDKEKDFYEKYIESIQRNLLLEFEQICAWSDNKIDNISNKLLARRTLKSGLFANKERVSFLIECDNAYYDNYSNNEYKGTFPKRKIKIKEKIFHPEKRLSILVKKQRRINNEKIKKRFYFIWAGFLYLYLRILRKI